MSHKPLAAVGRLAAVFSLFASTVIPNTHSHAASTADITLGNSAIRIDVDEDGLYGLGTSGGAPDITGDEDKRLLFGWAKDAALSSTSFSSVRISDTNGIADFAIASLLESAPTTMSGDSIRTEWVISNSVRIRQSLSIMNNPFSAQQDLMRVDYTVSNIGGGATSVGVRALLDVMVGNNDSAPYFVAGKNRSNLQQEFVAPNIPAYYVSFESNAFEANSLKGLGLLRGYGLITPDRVQIANWRELASKNAIVPWEHTVTLSETHGDSAVVVYWNPRALGPGQSVSFATAYGLAGQGGGALWLVAPVLAELGTREVAVEGWVNNSTTEDLGTGAITLTLPSGMSLVPGEPASKPITGLLAGQSRQNSWRVVIDDPQLPQVYTYTAEAALLGLTSPLTATARTIVVKSQRVWLPLMARVE